MSKYLKILFSTCLIVCITVCLGIFAVACNPDDSSDNNQDDKPYPSSVSITVLLDDETPAENVLVGICLVKDGELGACLSLVATDANGVATFLIYESYGTKDFEVHVDADTIPEGYGYLDDNGDPYGESGIRIDVMEKTSWAVTLSSVG